METRALPATRAGFFFYELANCTTRITFKLAATTNEPQLIKRKEMENSTSNVTLTGLVLAK